MNEHAHENPATSRDVDAPGGAAESLRVIAAQRRAAFLDTRPDGRLLFGVWGTAWLVGYLAMQLSADERYQPAPWAGLTFALLLVGATTVTALHIARRSAGVRGQSASTGRMYGAAWAVSFIVGFTLIGAIAQPLTGVEQRGEVMAVAANGIACLIVAALYMAGGAVWNEPRMFALGAWIGVVTAVAALVGMPALYLIMAVAGGGGFLVAAVVEHLRTYRGVPQGDRLAKGSA